MNRLPRLGLLAIAALLTLPACDPPSPDLAQVPTAPVTILPEPVITQPEPFTLPPLLPSLDRQPLHWFAPLPPMPTHTGRPYTGSDDFLQLFEPDAPWEAARAELEVFKLYGEWVAYHATDDELRLAIEGIRARNLALAVEAGPLNATDACGAGIEGFAGIEEGTLIAERILAAGGTLQLIALDEPYYYGHFYNGEGACHWTSQKIAADVDRYIRHMRTFFPDVRVGDTEPLPWPVRAGDYTLWLVDFWGTNRYHLDFLHLDIDWSRTNWPEMVAELDAVGEELGVSIGIIYTGNGSDQDDQSWLAIAGERVKRLEFDQGVDPDHVLFQSWNDKPDRVLPESEPFTFTGFIAHYFLDRAALGFPDGGGNLAFGRAVRVSAELPENVGRNAIDRDTGTIWSAGAGPPQWIEIDLGAVHAIGLIQLFVSQFPAGRTVHEVYGRVSTLDPYLLLATLDGSTSDPQVLEVTPPPGTPALQYIRILTTVSPSWVAWREIEIYGLP